MYVDSSTVRLKDKSYTRHLLRESYRDNGKVKHRTIANVSSCSEEEIKAIRLALRHKHDLTQLGNLKKELVVRQGLSVGALWTLYDVARQLGIVDALGNTRNGRLALWQVLARIIDQGSRLSAVRLATSHAACDVLNLETFNEDHLYQNLDWLCGEQSRIEDRLFRIRYKEEKPQLFLYDVTSSYLEGTQNEMGAFGYNRDGKKGKLQIVIGLLCDHDGTALSIEVFRGNTRDPATMASQVAKVAQRFGGTEVTFVGDRGMIKSKQIEDLVEHKFHYITAITKPQIEAMLKKGVIQPELFDEELAEVQTDEIRYILRRNPIRAAEIGAHRRDKLESLQKELNKQNLYLKEHPKASGEVALRKVNAKCKQLLLSAWVSVSESGRELTFSEDREALAENSKLDGCYVLKTDLKKSVASKELVHDRYKDLALVEWAFRTSKTVELELRPIHVRLQTRTRAHAFVVMLAYRIVVELARRWRDSNLTVGEGIDELSTLCAEEVSLKGGASFNKIPQPRESVRQLLVAARVKLPEALPSKGVLVTTKRKLQSRRKNH